MAITPNAPTGLAGAASGSFAAVPIRSTGSLSGYSTVPALTYSFDGNVTRTNLPGVTLTGWSAVIPAPQLAGSYSLTVFDGLVTGAVAFTVNAYAR